KHPRRLPRLERRRRGTRGDRRGTRRRRSPHRRAPMGRRPRGRGDARDQLDGGRPSPVALAECSRSLDRPAPLATAPDARVTPLPAWRQSDLPHPPAFTLVNAVRVIGPGTLLLGVSLGAGDWLLGPAVTVTYGPALLWLCTVSVILQAILNTEMA